MDSYPALYVPASGLLTSLPRDAPSRFVVGRSTRANFCVPDGAWSREQFCIRVEPGGLHLEQLSQKVPTLINGVRLSAPHRLRHGDRISVSSTSLIYLERADPHYGQAAAQDDAALTRKGDGAGKAPAAGDLPLTRDAIIGRERGSVDLVLDHPRVSRRHAQVVVKEGRVSLRDLGSSNGTFVNGDRIDAFRPLQVDDRIDIGPYSFRFTGHSLAQSTLEGNLRLRGYNLTRTVQAPAGSKKIRILDNVTLVVEPREFVCILGPSGSGKSTLMHALSAREPADDGQVFLNDVSLYANFQALKQGIAFVPQQDVLHEALTLTQALEYTAQLRLPPDTTGAGIQTAVTTALERVDLAPRARTVIRHLSGGQKKRASLANQIVSRPNLLFLDEVTSGLDEGTDWEMMKLFRRMAEDGMTIVCVTHTVANVDDFCHKVVVMANPGVLAFYGTPAEARRYFQVEKLGDLYRVLASRTGEEWRDAWQNSAECARYITGPIGPAPAGRQKVPAPAGQRHTLPEARRQFGILSRRYARLVFSDHKTLALAAAQSLLVGILLALVFGVVGAPGPKSPKSYYLLFFLGISCLWYGCNNAAKEIVKERPIYHLERDVNLSVPSYVLSKIALLSVVGLGQVALLFGVVSATSGMPGDGARQFAAMSAAVLAGTAIGLLLSAVSRTNDQASTLVPIALIPQILLAGVIVPNLPDAANFLAHTMASGFWVYKGMAAVLDKREGDASLALFVLLLHSLACVIASGYILFVRDARGEAVYGKAMGRWVKQASRVPPPKKL